MKTNAVSAVKCSQGRTTEGTKAGVLAAWVETLPAADKRLEYVFYTGAASDDIEFNLYGNGHRDEPGIDNFADVLAGSKVPTNLRGCLLPDGRVLLCSGQLPLIDPRRGVRSFLGIS